jgi:hypothetical protein
MGGPLAESWVLSYATKTRNHNPVSLRFRKSTSLLHSLAISIHDSLVRPESLFQAIFPIGTFLSNTVSQITSAMQRSSEVCAASILLCI